MGGVSPRCGLASPGMRRVGFALRTAPERLSNGAEVCPAGDRRFAKAGVRGAACRTSNRRFAEIRSAQQEGRTAGKASAEDRECGAAPAEGAVKRESARTGNCQLGNRVLRGFRSRSTWPLLRFRERAKIDLFVQFKEKRAVAAFERHAFGAGAAQKNTAVGSLEREEVGAAKKFTALFVFFFQQFGILAEEAVGLLVRRQVNACNQNQTLALLMLV